MIKFLADENIPPALVSVLRTKGYDIGDIKEKKLFGLSDEEVVKLAGRESRIILTCDKDFANLIKFPLRTHKGVILLRFSNLSPLNIIQRFIPLLETKIKDRLTGSLVIIKDDYIDIIEH